MEDQMLRQSADIPPDTWKWIVMGLCVAISTLCVYIAKGAEQRRKDHKEERDILLNIVKENSGAMTKLASVVERVQKTLDVYIHEDH